MPIVIALGVLVVVLLMRPRASISPAPYYIVPSSPGLTTSAPPTRTRVPQPPPVGSSPPTMPTFTNWTFTPDPTKSPAENAAGAELFASTGPTSF